MWVHVGSYNLRHKGARKCLISLNVVNLVAVAF